VNLQSPINKEKKDEGWQYSQLLNLHVKDLKF